MMYVIPEKPFVRAAGGIPGALPKAPLTYRAGGVLK
jgi:hypothetical protein